MINSQRRTPVVVAPALLAGLLLMSVPVAATPATEGDQRTASAVTAEVSGEPQATVSLSMAETVEGDSGIQTLTFILKVEGWFDGTISGIYQTDGAGEPYPSGSPEATATPDVDYDDGGCGCRAAGSPTNCIRCRSLSTGIPRLCTISIPWHLKT